VKPDILIVEDEPSILSSLEFILRHAGWTTKSVTSGEAALLAVNTMAPRAVILDVMLPRQSGFEVLKKLRQDRRTRDLPILILTAKGQQQDKRTAEGLGATDFVTKPYANAEVVEAVRHLLGEVPPQNGPASDTGGEPDR